MQAASNDAALALIQSGQVDWTHNFVPNVEKAYESKDKAHFHSFYATTAYPVSLVFDNTQYPYSLVAFRKALSLAIDRNTVSKLGEYGYAPPTDAIGLNGLFPQWVTDASVKAQAKALSTYNPTAAKKLLTDNGFTYKGSKLIDPKGNPVTLDIHVISGWSDWVASNQIITKNLQAIGIDSNVKLEPDWNSWFPNAFATKNPTLLWQNGSQASPYGFFNANLSQNSVIPSGSGRLDDRQLVAHVRRPGDRAAQPVEGDARREEAAGDRDAAREALPPQHADRARCSSGRGGRRTARSTSTASTRRRTSTATRSSPRTRTTSSRSPASAPAARPARKRKALVGAGRDYRSRPAQYSVLTRPMRWFLRRLVFYAFAIWVALTLNFLLPRLMPGDPIGGVLQRLSPAQIAANPGIIQTYQALLGGGKGSIWHDYVVYLHRLVPPRLRHLDVQLSGAGLRGDRPDAPLLDLPRRRRVPPRVRARHQRSG